ncbi:DUF4817 domain-containing protein [Trichonephila clavipes]|nr:DUF4817 domain-containing protein [Trichonephila clavipes]
MEYNRNKRESARLYAIKFSSGRHPSYCIINTSAVKRLYTTRSSYRRIPLSRATHLQWIPAEGVLGYALAHPESSVRDYCKACSYSKSMVKNILHTYGAFSYRPVLAQELMAGDRSVILVFAISFKHTG